MKKTIFTLALVSAIKRKQIKEVLTELLLINGKDEEAQEVKEAGRLTNALIDRVCASSIEGLLGTEVDNAEESVEASQHAENELEAQFKDLGKLIDAGDKKKAKKLYKAMKESGLKGSEMDKAKKAIKAL